MGTPRATFKRKLSRRCPSADSSISMKVTLSEGTARTSCALRGVLSASAAQAAVPCRGEIEGISLYTVTPRFAGRFSSFSREGFDTKRRQSSGTKVPAILAETPVPVLSPKPATPLRGADTAARRCRKSLTSGGFCKNFLSARPTVRLSLDRLRTCVSRTLVERRESRLEAGYPVTRI